MPIETKGEYLERLKRHDWFYEYSEDARVYRRGREQRHHLYAARERFDPDWEEWNKIAPPDYRKEG